MPIGNFPESLSHGILVGIILVGRLGVPSPRYELAFHDITQANMCGCTQFNMTRYGNIIEDMFINISKQINHIIQ